MEWGLPLEFYWFHVVEVELDVDGLIDRLVVLFHLLLGLRVEEKNFLDVVLYQPADGIVDGGEIAQLCEGLLYVMFTLVLSKSL
jgi:hypothetical protein